MTMSRRVLVAGDARREGSSSSRRDPDRMSENSTARTAMEPDAPDQTLPAGGQPQAPMDLPPADIPVFRPRNRQLTIFWLAFVARKFGREA